MGNSMKRVSKQVRETYESNGQGHVFSFLDKKMLSAKEEDAFAKQLEEIDVARAIELFKGSMEQAGKATEAKITPIGRDKVASVELVKEKGAEWAETAYEAMSKGQVAFIVLSGGQGTRLGFSRAKGMYDIQLPSHKTLFQLMGERLVKLHELVKAKYPDAAKANTVRIPWYIMTSPLNDEDTRGFFAENKFFGLDKKDVVFFAQGTLPCMTTEGKFILENKGKVAFAPDGNGGIYRSMMTSGVIKDMEKRGVEHMHVTSVDNAVVRVADPAFVGYCLSKGAEVGNKGCPKVSWDEKVGVMALKDDKFSIVEYSELDETTAKLTSESGELLLSTGNICNHFFSLSFLRDTAIPALMQCYHIAHKKISAADPETGESVKPTSNNGIKLEMFIFDVFPLSDKMGIFECNRAEEFSPVKNAPGEKTDSPDSARQLIAALHRGWLEAAGAKLSGADDALCEVTPLVSYSGEGLADLATTVPELKLPLLVCREGEAGASTGAEAVHESANLKVVHFVNEAGVNVYQVSKL